MTPKRELFIDLVGPVVLLLCMCITVLCLSCASSKPNEQFHRSKYDVSTGTHPMSGQPAVRQTWFKRFWFWQRQGARPNSHDR